MEQLFEMEITLDMMISSIKRELNYRYRVYPRLVEQRKMSLETSNKEIKIMEGILAKLAKEKEDDSNRQKG